MRIFIKKFLSEYGVHFAIIFGLTLLLISLLPIILGFPSPNRLGSILLAGAIAVFIEATGLFKFKL